MLYVTGPRCNKQGGETPATEIFGGSMCSTVRPAGGGPPSITVGAFIMLQLYIGHPSVVSIEAALQRFAEPEHLEAYKVRIDSPNRRQTQKLTLTLTLTTVRWGIQYVQGTGCTR